MTVPAKIAAKYTVDPMRIRDVLLRTVVLENGHWRGHCATAVYGHETHPDGEVFELSASPARILYHLSTRTVPYGFDTRRWHVTHLCEDRLCCNPAHLMLRSNVENVKDIKRGWKHPLFAQLLQERRESLEDELQRCS